MHFKTVALGLLFSAPALGVVTIVPLGDSLTSGVGSSDMGGYRKVVKNNLGNTIDFLGRKGDGAFVDNEDEGWGGFSINMIRDQVVNTIPQHSGFGNVILLTAGTNEFVWNENPTEDGAAARANQALVDMNSLLNATFGYAGNAVTLYVSTIPAIRDWVHPQNTYTYPEVDMFNAGLPGLVNQFRGNGYDVRFVDTMSGLNLQTDFADGIHPNDLGYAKIGAAWTAALTPEPTSAVLALAPLAMLATRRRRQR